jgi:hypothetical protein
MASLLQYMQPALYALTLVNTVVKVQLPYATLLHWGTSSGYTLGLQAALKHPKIRALLGRGAAGGSAAAEPGVDPGLVTRVAANQNANVLVVIAAQQAAAQRYSGALYCLGKALELDPANVRWVTGVWWCVVVFSVFMRTDRPAVYACGTGVLAAR